MAFTYLNGLYPLYENYELKYVLRDFLYTFNEKSNIKTSCMNSINSVLKSPSTAKYPGMSEWKITKGYGEWDVISYVDSQNGFGATLRSYFEIKIKDNTVTYFVFDGKQYK